MIAKGLHRQHTNSLLDRDRHDVFGKRAEMRVHDIDRHLYSVEMEAMLLSSRKHSEMHCRILVAGEPDVANLACFTGGDRSFKRSPGRKNAVRIFQANHLVKLDQIDHISLQPPERESAGGVFPGQITS